MTRSVDARQSARTSTIIISSSTAAAVVDGPVRQTWGERSLAFSAIIEVDSEQHVELTARRTYVHSPLSAL